MTKLNIRILVVEDSATQAEMLRHMLVSKGYDVIVARNGAEGLDMAKKEEPSIIISDIVMPKMDGYELCRQIKADENLKNIPFILTTVLSEPKDVVKGLECGADNFIMKPYDEEFLLSRVQYILINRELRETEKAQMVLKVSFANEIYTITSDRLQILNLLLSTYEAAVKKNQELAAARDELRRLNEKLEEMVKERTASLNERVKELRCLFGISTLMQKLGNSIEEIIQNAVDLLPTGWQYPEITCARITIDGQEFTTGNFLETAWRQASPISVNDEPSGTVEVYYLEERPFLKEERSLIDDIARQLGSFIERKLSQERLQHLNMVLRAIRGVNQLITREGDRNRLIKDACKSLVSTRGYYSAWIALWDESGKVVSYAEAGIGKDFLPMEEQLKRNDLPMCHQEALKKEVAVIIKEPGLTCVGCPLSHWYNATTRPLTYRLEHGGNIYGFLTISGPTALVTDKEEIGLFEEVASDIALCLSNISREEKRKQAEEEIKTLQRQMEFILGATKTGLDIIDSSFNIRYIDPEWKKLYGDPTGRKCYEYFMDRGEVCPGCGIIKALETKTATVTEEILLKEGNRPVQVATIPFQNDKGEWLVAEVNVDIAERKRTEDELKRIKHQIELILNTAGEGILGLDIQGKHTFINPAAAEMLGYEIEELIGRGSHKIWHHSKPDGSPCPEDQCPIYQSLKDGTIHVEDHEIFWRKDGTSFPVEYTFTPIKEKGEIIGAVVTFSDITERKQMQEKLEYLAYYDALTGLTNRNLFIDRLTQGIARAEYSKKVVAVMVVDIDRFKSINDAYGFDAGDAVLQEVAKRLLSSVRDGDTIARLGNDDFGVLLIDIADSADIILVIEKIMKKVSQPVQFDGKEIMLTLSAGISVYPYDGNDAPSLLKSSNLAFAKAKQQGRKNYQFYTEDLDVKASEFVLMEKNLFNAMRNEEFILHYQPYWDINTKKIVGMEALIRWISPESGLVSPGKFIPILEDTRMIIEVGEWILRTAIRQVKEWQRRGLAVVPISVNLSLIQFRQKDLSGMIEGIIRKGGLSPSLLTLEITESAFMQDTKLTYSILKSLKDIGVSVSIDDFGTGYSSLAHLKRFPIDNLKIDMSFIREIAADPDTASIVTAIIAMAHTLNLKTIAEGIETQEQWKILRLLRCDMGQGYYFSKPLPAEEIEKLLLGGTNEQ